MGCRGRDVGPEVANEDRSPIQGILAVELATPILEFADVGRAAHGTVFGVGPVEAPLMRLRIVEAQGQALNVTGGAVDFTLRSRTAVLS